MRACCLVRSIKKYKSTRVTFILEVNIRHEYRLTLSYVLLNIQDEVIKLTIDTSIIVPMTEANQNFSKVVRLVDESGMAVIMKNNKPRYMVLDFKEYEEIQSARKKFFTGVVDSIISENMEALLELAK